MPAGRPPMWTDPQALEQSVEEYFKDNKSPTWTGLALHLGFESRKSLWEYGKKPEFSNPIKRALLRIEESYERGLRDKNATGSIFALKNFDWKDRTEVDQNVKGGLNIRFEEPEEYKRLYPSQDQGNIGDLDGGQ